MRAKKSFGQHFLRVEAIAEKIADSLTKQKEYGKVVEVGPGKGMLTKYLLAKNYDLTTVEADRDMVTYLNEHYPELEGRIVSNDFLKTDLQTYMGTDSFAVIGNFPYNISSQILFKVLENKTQIPEVVGMFQKEVAERIVSGPGSKVYGVISVLIQAYYEGTYLFTVDRTAFSPPPKVQSAVIRLVRKDDQNLGCDVVLFKKVVKAAFSQRRKMLRNTMKPLFQDKTVLQDVFFQKRPEQLSVEDFIKLTLDISEDRRKHQA